MHFQGVCTTNQIIILKLHLTENQPINPLIIHCLAIQNYNPESLRSRD